MKRVSNNTKETEGAFDLPIRPSVAIHGMAPPSCRAEWPRSIRNGWNCTKSCSFSAILKQFQIYGRINRTLPEFQQE